jgi:hypothetical protein
VCFQKETFKKRNMGEIQYRTTFYPFQQMNPRPSEASVVQAGVGGIGWRRPVSQATAASSDSGPLVPTHCFRRGWRLVG